MKWPLGRKQIILGSELASAMKAEDERLASGISVKSPLPDDQYDLETGDYNLVAVSPLPLDRELRTFMSEYLDQGPDQRDVVRQRLSFDDLYTLIHFVKRASVIALNHDPVEWCRAGLVALSLIDENRVDWRDAKWAAGILEHAILNIGERGDSLIVDADNLSSTSAEFLRHLLQTSKLGEWGYSQIRTADGVGLIKCGFAEYNPTIHLTAIALRISESLTSGRYVGDVEIASSVPEIWFAPNSRNQVKSRLRRSQGAAAIRGTLREGFSQKGNQMFVEWVVAMPTADDAKYLVEAVGSGKYLNGRYVLGISEHKMFALLVTGSVKEGVEPYETPASLAELGALTLSILRAL